MKAAQPILMDAVGHLKTDWPHTVRKDHPSITIPIQVPMRPGRPCAERPTIAMVGVFNYVGDIPTGRPVYAQPAPGGAWTLFVYEVPTEMHDDALEHARQWHLLKLEGFVRTVHWKANGSTCMFWVLGRRNLGPKEAA